LKTLKLVAEISNFFVASLIIFNVSTKLFSDLYPTQSRSFRATKNTYRINFLESQFNYN